MKILFLNNFYYLRGGSERVLFDEMRILREAGHDVAIYSRGHEHNAASEFSEYFPPPFDTERIDLSLKTLRAAKELIYSGASRRGLAKVIDLFKPDVAHAHNIYGRLSLSVLDELKVASIPVVMTLHDLKMHCPSYLMLNHGRICEQCKGHRYYHAVRTRCHKGSYAASAVYALESWLNYATGRYRSVGRFVTPSLFLMDKCVEYGWDRGKITYLPNFIDLALKPEFRHGGEYILYIGRLSREKGVGALLQAYSRLKRPIPLKIVGDGPEKEGLQRSIGIAGSTVTFTGYLSGPALTDALLGAKVVVMPSECYENAPMTILEAFAHHKPVIGARIGGIPEMIHDGVNGYLFQPGNAADLQAKLELFLNLPEQRVLEMGKSAREKVENEYNAESHYQRLINVYRKVTGKRCA